MAALTTVASTSGRRTRPVCRSKQMHVLDVNQMTQFFVNSFKLVAIFATVCVARELIFPAYRYSFASYVRGVRNWIIRIGCGVLLIGQ